MEGALNDPVDIIVNSVFLVQMFLKRREISSSDYQFLSAEKTQNTVGRNFSELLQFMRKHFDVDGKRNSIIVETFHRTEMPRCDTIFHHAMYDV